jgi:hypothetical protein
MREMRNDSHNYWEASQKTDHLEKVRCSWEDNIKMYHSKYGVREGTGLIWLIIETGGPFIVNAVMGLRIPYKEWNFSSSEATGGI